MKLNRLTAVQIVLILFAIGHATQCRSDDDGDSNPIGMGSLGSSYGVRRYAPGAWGRVSVDLSNRTDQAIEVDAVAGFAEEPDVQYVRRLWLPPRSVRRSSIPVKTPSKLPSDTSADCVSMVVDRSQDPPKLLRFHGERVRHETLLPLADHGVLTGMLASEDEHTVDPVQTDWAYEAVVAMRNQRRLSRRLAILNAADVLSVPESLDALDHLVITNDRCFHDEALMSAVRGWLAAGGELWITLDQVEFSGVERLLGEAFPCTLVNRVELHEVQVQSSRSAFQPQASLVLEDAVPFARVLQQGMHVTHTMGEWPVAFWTDVGRGRVVFTTLGAQGWLRARTPQDSKGLPQEQLSGYVPIEPMDAVPVIARRESTEPPQLSLQDYATQRIGYRIVPRSVVIGVLGLFCLFLSVAGLVLIRRGRPQSIGWLAPASAAVAALILAIFGGYAKHRIPPTVVHAHYVEATGISGQADVTGEMAIYNPTASADPLGADKGGVFSIDASGLAGKTRRMVWNDFDQWRWEDIKLPPGLRVASVAQSMHAGERIEAIGEFTAAGFEGTVRGPFEAMADAIIHVPAQRNLAVAVDGRALTSGPGDTLPEGEFIANNLLSDEQRRRNGVYRALMAEDSATLRSQLPFQLLGWTEPVRTGFIASQEGRQVGASLWSIPLQLRRSEPGAKMVIPATFITYRTVRGPTNEGVSSAYDAREGQWLHTGTATKAWLRFQIPPSVLPLRITRAEIKLQLTAPDRTLQIVGLASGRQEVLFSKSNPIGQMNVSLDDPKYFSLDEQGGFALGVHIGEPSRGTDDKGWDMDFLELGVEGIGG